MSKMRHKSFMLLRWTNLDEAMIIDREHI